ncbi:MAG: hypothetical protein KAQ85_10155, partial [Thermodesulfovibrionia bacterium]|nr:hypothetical protein [Thermodesulfovibrionia bacterium]
NTIIEVESSEALFDIDFFIPIGLKEIEQGGIIRADISISAISQIEPMESRLIYVIKDMDGNVIISQEGTILVGDSASSYVEMKLPGDIDIGDHVFYVKLIYKDNMFMRSDLFTVIGEESPLSLVEKPAPIWEESYFKIISFIAVFFVASILAYMAFTNFAVLYNIKAIIANVDKHIKDGELDEAKSAYLKVKDLYHKLSKRTKKKVYLKCMEFHRKLNMK